MSLTFRIDQSNMAVDIVNIGVIIPRHGGIMTDVEIGWAAGFFEGEGFCRAGRGHGWEIAVGQVDIEPLNKLESMFGGRVRVSGPGSMAARRKQFPNAQQFHYWRVNGFPALRFLQSILPHVISPRRREQIEKCIATPIMNKNWASYPEKLKAIKIAAQRMIKGKRNGKLVAQIAQEFGVSPKTVYNIREGYLGKEPKEVLGG